MKVPAPRTVYTSSTLCLLPAKALGLEEKTVPHELPYSVGFIPVCFRNISDRLPMHRYPAISAIRETGGSVSRRRRPAWAYAGPRYTAERLCIRLSSSSIRPSANSFRPLAKLSGNCIDNECPDNLRYGPADMYRVDYISEEIDPQASCIQGFYIKVSCVQFSCIKSGGKSL